MATTPPTGRARGCVLFITAMALGLVPATVRAQADERLENPALRGIGFRIGGILSQADDYGGTRAGALFDMSCWVEQPHFAIEPRVGFHFDVESGENSFFELPIDVGAFLIPATWIVAPFLGGGGGVRYVREVRPIDARTGTSAVAEGENHHEDGAWGPSLFARVGLLLGRGGSFRFAINVDYNVTFVVLNEHSNRRSLSAGVSFIFWRSTASRSRSRRWRR